MSIDKRDFVRLESAKNFGYNFPIRGHVGEVSKQRVKDISFY